MFGTVGASDHGNGRGCVAQKHGRHRKEGAVPGKLLCIDDEQRIVDLLTEELSEQGYAVHGATSGPEGFAAILRLNPDLVICDINMPGMTGFEVLEKLKTLSPQFSRMPFIFLSALNEREDILKGRRLGADDYVTKPIDFEMLLEVVKARLNPVARKANARPAVSLTEREIEALTWSARGKSSADIAVLMEVSERTVNFHIANAMQKFGVATRIQAAVKASLAGIIKE
ncbi:MAG: response regulator [Candidatus Hydrogenedens sp.]|nr:response regulator [Candidatus Hydrogenedens sp.]